jgi:predicted nucleotidyltransferase component of viral defense system
MVNNQVHEKYMKNILTTIFSHQIGNFLAFKGGTLVYLLYKLDRFSTDLDLDLLDISQEQLVIEKMREILIGLGEIKNETLGKNIHRWIFRYDEKNMNIKIELNKKIWIHNTYISQTISDVTLSCMTSDCIFANKLVALSERFYPRDLYDVYFFFREKFPIKEALIQERTGLTTKKFLQKLIKELPNYFTATTVLTGLGEVLDSKQKNRVKKYLLVETIHQINTFLLHI